MKILVTKKRVNIITGSGTLISILQPVSKREENRLVEGTEDVMDQLIELEKQKNEYFQSVSSLMDDKSLSFSDGASDDPKITSRYSKSWNWKT